MKIDVLRQELANNVYKIYYKESRGALSTPVVKVMKIKVFFAAKNNPRIKNVILRQSLEQIKRIGYALTCG